MKEEEKLTFDDYASNEKIGEFIRKLRLSHNMSQKEFAKLLKVSRETITKAENGERGISLEVYKKINKLFGITFEEIIGGKVKEKPKEKDALNILLNRNLFKVLAFLFIYFLLILYGTTRNTNNLYNLEFYSNNIYIDNATLTLLKNGDYRIDIKSFNNSSVVEGKTFDIIIKMKYKRKDKTIFKCKYADDYCKQYYKNPKITKPVLKKNINKLYVEVKQGDDVVKGKLKARLYATSQPILNPVILNNDLEKYDRSKNSLIDWYDEVKTSDNLIEIDYNKLMRIVNIKNYNSEENSFVIIKESKIYKIVLHMDFMFITVDNNNYEEIYAKDGMIKLSEKEYSIIKSLVK